MTTHLIHYSARSSKSTSREDIPKMGKMVKSLFVACTVLIAVTTTAALVGQHNFGSVLPNHSSVITVASDDPTLPTDPDTPGLPPEPQPDTDHPSPPTSP